MLDSTIADTSDRLKAAVSELAGLQTLLLSDNLDPRILADFRDAVECGTQHGPRSNMRK